MPLNQWDALCYYCDDGLAEPDNNAAERALRTVISSSAAIMAASTEPCCTD